MMRKALRGNVQAFSEIADRVDGKPRQSIEHSGPDGGAISLNLEDVQKRIEELLALGERRVREEREEQALPAPKDSTLTN
jgi:hypothetical protein